MLLNYLRIARRTLWRNRTTTAINLLGLSVSLAVCFLVVVFVHEQWKMDRFHPDADQVHYVATTAAEYGGRLNATTPAPLADALRSSFAGAEAITRIAYPQDTFVETGETSVGVEAAYADASFFDVFSGFHLLAGDRSTALEGGGHAVLTPEAARRIYGESATPEDVVGRTFSLRAEHPYTVTGVLAPPEGPTHLVRDILLSYARVEDGDTSVEAWTDIFSQQWSYVRLRDGVSPEALEQAATNAFQRSVPEKHRAHTQFRVESLSDLRFGGTAMNPLSIRTQIPRYFYVFFLGLAVVVLLAAGFNYVNLTTAHSLQRAKEIGVRKTVGANSGQLAAQFLGESVVTCMLGGLGAMGLLALLIPAFNNLYLWNLLEMPALSRAIWSEPVLLAVLFGITLLFGIAAGLYPAVVLARSQPKEVLGFSPSVSSPFGSLSVRKVLIGAQFAFALVLLVTATTLYRQSVKMVDTSFDLKTDRMVAVDLHDVELDRFRRAVERDSDVASVAGIGLLPMSTGWARDAARTAPGGTLVQTYQYDADTSFVQDMGLKLEASLPNWTVTYSREEGVLINETAARSYGYEPATDALGETLYVGSSGEGEEVTSYTIAGIIDDFVFTGVAQVYTGQGQSRQASPPVYLRADTSGYSEAIVLSRTADLAALRDRIETTWTQELQTVYPFESQFYSELTQERNGPMQDLASIAGFTASLAVLITLLGLLSIAAHTVETRRQEIGIRKALGATISRLVVLLSRDFLWLVGAAVVVSLPVAWWLNAAWLQFLPDSVSIGLGPMALTVVALLALAVLTVASQAFRSARLNPAYTLRDE